MENIEISKATLERLPQYLHYLESLNKDIEYISSKQIAADLGFVEIKTRKDLACVSDKGKPKKGYLVTDLINDISSFLGCDNISNAVIVGPGKIGRAILGYEGFSRYGVDIIAAFTHHANKYIDYPSSKPILDLSEFEGFCKNNNIKIGIITVPVTYAQEICDMMVAVGIKAIWNFARTNLNVPGDVIVRQEDLAAGISILACQLKNQENKI